MIILFGLFLPCDIKYGILNLPSITTFLSACKVGPSNGREPHTRTYITTPKLWKEISLLVIFIFIYQLSNGGNILLIQFSEQNMAFRGESCVGKEKLNDFCDFFEKQ